MPTSNKSSKGSVRPYNAKINILTRILDGAVIVASLALACLITGTEWVDRFTWDALITIGIFQAFAEYNELYRNSRGATMQAEAASMLTSWFITALLVLLLSFLFNPVAPNFSLSLFWIFTTAFLLTGIHLLFNWIFYFRAKTYGRHNVGMVGATQLGRRLEKIFEERPSLGMNFVGYYDDRIDDHSRRLSNEEIKYCGDLDTLIEHAKDGTLNMLYIVLPLRAERRIQDLLDKLSDSTASVYYVPDLFMFDLLHSRWNTLEGIPIVSIYETPFYGVDGMAKRITDVILSLVILAIIGIPMIFIAIAVKLTSPGPVLFKQWRYGMRGERIHVYKFRSMRDKADKDEKDVPQAKRDDPRVTPIGAFLRRTSLDELPQFFNVLSGTMSIVGPRPHAIPHNEHYRKKIKGYMLRHKVKPGITGLAQIKGFRGETETLDKMEGRINYDLDYIRNWSLLLDIKIIFATIFKGFVNKQAY